MESLRNWLIGEAGAAWIFGVAGILGAIYVWLKRDRPPRAIVQEIDKTFLFGANPSVRSKLEVYYTDKDGIKKPIKSLVRKRLVIYNNGTKDILEEIKVTLGIINNAYSEFKKDQFIEFSIDERDSTIEILNEESDHTFVSKITIIIPYLNSYSSHCHYINCYLLSEHEVDLDLIEGYGKGWSTLLVSKNKISNEIYKIWKRIDRINAVVCYSLYIIGLIGGIMFIVSFYRHPGNKVFLAYLRPTPENVSAAIQYITEYLTILQKNGYWASIIYTYNKFDYSGAFIALFSFVLEVFIRVELRGNRLKVLLLRFWGLQPESSFADSRDDEH